MLLHAVIVPPLIVLEALADVIASVDRPTADAAAPARKGFLARRGSRGAPAADSPNADVHELDLVPIQRMNLPVTGFGNVTSGDARKLTEALNEAAATWTRPTVLFAGGGALEFPDDRSIWAKLDGDIGPLMTVASGVTQSVERLGFFVDRRKFRPSLSVATITGQTTAPYLERVVAAFDAFRGEAWTVEYVSLVTRSFDEGSPAPKEIARIPLLPA
jgi:2'-5' RNA ligase